MKRLDKDLSSRIFRKIDQIRDDPLLFVEFLRTYKIYKLRIGDYRALLDIDTEKKVIEVQIVDHRKRIYKNI